MDFISFDLSYAVLICTRCQYALIPSGIAAHLKTTHGDEATPAERRGCVEAWKGRATLQPEAVSRLQMSPQSAPIPHLALYHDGIRCRLCAEEQPYICRSRKGMQAHLREAHEWQNCQGKGRSPRAAILAETAYANVVIAPVSCQTFYQQSKFVRFFQVTCRFRSRSVPLLRSRDTGQETQLSATIGEQVEQQLVRKLQAVAERTQAVGLSMRHATQVDPWLDKTLWEQYLRGQDLATVAQLINLPLERAEDRRLGLLLASFDRLIEQTRSSIVEREVNVFDLHRVNNFVSRYGKVEVVLSKQQKRAMMRPLLSKLQEGTYKRYKDTWKRLLCFVYRLVCQKQQPALHYKLTDAQSTALEQLLRAAEALDSSELTLASDCRDSFLEPLQVELDQACLRFCIALLDHRLMGPIDDSVIVGFLAVQGIDVKKNGFYEAACYTTHLSALVKIAQLLVLRQAIAAKEARECEHPAQALEEMQERFMVYNTRSPMNWIQKLRTYGKRITDTTTGLGHIVWSEDAEELSYKGLKLSMTGLKGFISQQVETAEAQLHSLLRMHLKRGATLLLPELDLASLKDNPAVKTPGWSFLRDPRNAALQGHEHWLLHRIAETVELQQEFFTELESLTWRRPAAERYLKQVDAFLERLLLIAHIVSGQPARGSELVSLQHCNTTTIDSLRRNVFLENGLISFVTFYHKGYSVKGNVNIIHRYLPTDLSRLVVYYLWLVLPFANQLRLLALDQPAIAVSSPFLWAQPYGDASQFQLKPWPSSRLSHMLKQEFQTHLHTQANIQMWRHAAIAISRQHLRQAKFRKDFDVGAGPAATWNDAQACHAANLAASIYARGIEEAPGHTEQARAEYRQISREWHAWLGLAPVPNNPLPKFGKGFHVIRKKPATTWMDAQAGHTTDTAERIYARIGSSGLSLKRKALSDISENQTRKKPVFRVEDKADRA